MMQRPGNPVPAIRTGVWLVAFQLVVLGGLGACGGDDSAPSLCEGDCSCEGDDCSCEAGGTCTFGPTSGDGTSLRSDDSDEGDGDGTDGATTGGSAVLVGMTGDAVGSSSSDEFSSSLPNDVTWSCESRNTCDLTCGTGCTTNCNGMSLCEGSCESDCTLDCAGTSECTLATGVDSTVSCAGGSECNVELDTGSTLNCTGTSRCTIDCPKGACTAKCEGAADCEVICGGTEPCHVECNGQRSADCEAGTTCSNVCGGPAGAGRVDIPGGAMDGEPPDLPGRPGPGGMPDAGPPML